MKLDRSSPSLLRPLPWLPPPWHVASGSTWNGFGVSCSTLHELKEPLQLSTIQIYHHLKCIEKPHGVPIAARFQPPRVAQEHTCHMFKSCTIHADLANHHLVELYNNLPSRLSLHNLRTVRSGEAGVYNFPHYKSLPSIHPKTSIHFKYPNHSKPSHGPIVWLDFLFGNFGHVEGQVKPWHLGMYQLRGHLQGSKIHVKLLLLGGPEVNYPTPSGKRQFFWQCDSCKGVNTSYFQPSSSLLYVVSWWSAAVINWANIISAPRHIKDLRRATTVWQLKMTLNRSIIPSLSNPMWRWLAKLQNIASNLLISP